MFKKLFSAINSLWQEEPPQPGFLEKTHTIVEPQELSIKQKIAPTIALQQGSLEETAADPVLVHREVLDETLAVNGVEFFVRGELHQKIDTGRSAARRFLDGMLLDQLANFRATPLHLRRPWIQLAESSMLRLGTGKLPPHACVLLVTEDTNRRAHADMAETIATMRDAGHEVWLDDCVGSQWFKSLAGVANGATLRLALRTPFEVADLFNDAKMHFPTLKLGAWDVGTQEDFEMLRKLHCTRFSGSFVTRREDWSSNEFAPHMLNVAYLINQIREETNLRAIAKVLKQDMAMSYRLLRYVNSAAQGLTQHISSIEQGLLILGQEQLDRWLTLILLSGRASGDTALTEIALTRARFLELCGTGRLPPAECERLFVLGLFSMLDVALKVPLETAIRPLRLPEIMNAALLRREGQLGMYLALADACTRGIGSEIAKNALMLGLTSNKVSARQIEAINWVAEIAAQPAQRATQ